MIDLIVIGGGAAGMMTALMARRRGLAVTVIEPNDRMGKKIRITGKGRCNVTNDCEPTEFLRQVKTNPKFLKSALYGFTPANAIQFFEELGVPMKTERGNRVFPVSDSAHDVANALEREARRVGVRFVKDRAIRILTEDGVVSGVETKKGTYSCNNIALCTGGLSYPGTGSTGDGYDMATTLGHNIITPRASLIPMEAEDFCSEMQGLSLRNVTLSLYRGDKLLFNELGEMLFTHFGVSGPLVLSASACLGGNLDDVRILIDLKPGLTSEKLDERILRDFSENKNRDFRNSLDALLPQKMIPVIVWKSGIEGDTKVNSITREQRLHLVHLIKHFPIKIYGLRPVTEAIITAGGVDVKEVNPRTMESKLVPGLYFAGEILDMDACTGGFNLQIAWSTAAAVARSLPDKEFNYE